VFPTESECTGGNHDKIGGNGGPEGDIQTVNKEGNGNIQINKNAQKVENLHADGLLELDEDRVKTEDVNTVAEGNCKWLSYSELMMDSYPPKSKIIYLKAYKMFERFLKCIS